MTMNNGQLDAWRFPWFDSKAPGGKTVLARHEYRAHLSQCHLWANAAELRDKAIERLERIAVEAQQKTSDLQTQVFDLERKLDNRLARTY